MAIVCSFGKRAALISTVIAAVAHGLRAGPGSDIIAAAGVSAGLCVHVGCGDGTITRELHNEGRLLVHALARNAQSLTSARKAIREAGVYGLVSVEMPHTLKTLPYADDLVNLLVADLDALGADGPAGAEIDRVLAPRGVAYVKRGGSWSRTIKPVPARTDEWAHYFYDHGGTGSSRDQIVAPPNGLKWIANRTFGPKMGWDTQSGIRLHDGKAVYSMLKEDQMRKARAPSRLHPGVTIGRDAYSGVLLWRRERVRFEERFSFVTGGGEAFLIPDVSSHAVAVDLENGATVRTYTSGLKTGGEGDLERFQQCYYDGLLIQTFHNEVVALDAASGALKWRHTEQDPDLWLYWPTVDEATGRLFVVSTREMGRVNYNRWPRFEVEEVVCLDLAGGSVQWRNTTVKGTGTNPLKPGDNPAPYKIGQLMVSGDLLGFHSENEGLGALRIADGSSVWKTFFMNPPVHMSIGHPSAVIWDGNMYGGSNGLWEYELATGTHVGDTTDKLQRHGWNMRCTRTYATANYIMCGFGNYYDLRDPANASVTFTTITRGQCAQMGVPGNGMTYYHSNGCMGCVPAQLRGYLALYRYDLHDPLPDAQRLRTDGATTDAAAASVSISPAASTVVFDWDNTTFFRTATLETQDVATATTLKAHLHEHRLDAERNGQAAWSFTAGGRISSRPVVHGGNAYFGCHDGYVYCVSSTDGALEWRYLAAPSELKIVAYSQVESAWPVYSVVLYDGKICYAAGRHGETDGGIWVGGLDPASGAGAWRMRLFDDHVAVRISAKVRANPSKYHTLDELGEHRGIHVDSTGALKVGFTTIDPSNPQDRIGNLWSTLSPDDIVGQTPVAGRMASPGPGPAARPALGRDWFRLPADADARITLVEVRGRSLRTLFNGPARRGLNRFTIPHADLPAGMYFIRLESAGETRNLRVLRLH